jgi:hypothetical protein
MPAPLSSVTYKLKIFPVLTGQQAGEAINIATPVFEQNNISGTTFDGNFFARQHYLDFLSHESEGTTYYWSVRATDEKGIAIGKNNGWAEPRLIAFGENEPIPPTFGTTVNSFFDIFIALDIAHNNEKVCITPEPCGKHAKFFDTKFGPWRIGKSYSQYYNVWVRNVYKLYRVIDCGLEKGHAGPHHGSSTVVYVLDHVDENKDYHGLTPPPPTPPASMDDEPPKKDQMSKEDIAKIDDDNKSNDKGTDGNNGGNVGQDNGGDNTNSGTSGTGNTNGGKKPDDGKKDSGGVVPGGVKVEHVPCPYHEDSLLRTVAGSWRKVSTTVKHVTYRKTTVAWVEVTWKRDIWNVYRDVKCTLEKGHAGPHQCVSQEVYVKWCTFTVTKTYGPGEPQTAPTDGPGDDIPQEDPK